MRQRLTRAEARAYARRWRLVNARERHELRATAMEEKLRHLAGLMAAARQLGWSEALAAEDAEEHARWRLLQKAYGF